MRFPLLLEENQSVEEEHADQWQRAERHSHETMYSQELQPSQVLNEASKLTALVPKSCSLDMKSQIRNALRTAVVSGKNISLSE